MQVTILGYYGGYPTNDVGTSAYLIQSDGYNLLMDAGSASLLALEHHIDPLDLDAVLLSHYHHDHIADLGVLQFTRQLKRTEKGDRAPLLSVYGHSEDQEAFRKTTLEEVSQGIDYTKEDSVTIGPFDVTYLKTLHPVPCYAFKIVERVTGKTLVYTADSGYLEAFLPFAEGADLLITDTNLFKGMEGHSVHMTSKECGYIANKSNIDQLVLSHLPQKGNLDLLREEAAAEAPNTRVMLAEKHLKISI
ncbi:MBL fold metallo-hydrolase [Marinilactibacillus kalidii]|uniref:MBL fold metallo-hydrolase n=1 Tax=Marinilactibacillus kalidii TaxID=2820274 RepID=UPI001ABEB805|nr:MBL fold metallo-hydrolase [Marinilactibacillus kalidii]